MASSNASPVAVHSGSTTYGVSGWLSPGAAIGGSVTNDGVGVTGVTVEIFSSAGAVVGSVQTGSTGRYRLAGLPSAGGDTACFDASKATIGTGFISECHGGVQLDARLTPASGLHAGDARSW